MQGATQDVVIHQVLRAAPPGQHWILVPTQPSGNEIPQTRHLEYNSTGGALEAQPPQPRPEPLSVLQLQQPVLPPLIPKPQATEPVLGKDTSMEDRRTPKLQVEGSDKLYVEETLARMEQAAKESRAELQKGLAILVQTLNWLKSIGVQNNQTYQGLVTLRAEHEKATVQSTVQFKTQQEALMVLIKMVGETEAERESHMDMLTRSMTELAENVRTIAKLEFPMPSKS